jgi:hypothetical protein
MSLKSIQEKAESFGLNIEAVAIPENDNAYKIYKGAKQIFIGSEEAVEAFFVEYAKDRPALLEGSMYGYKE